MKSKLISIIFTATLLSFAESCLAQNFINLDFESANVSGYSPPSSTGPANFFVPINSAFPGWSGSYSNTWSGMYSNTTFGGTYAATQVGYDFMTLGNMIDVVDTNLTYNQGTALNFAFNVFQGNYSAVLFGGENGGGPTFYSATISQTGLVPAGTASLRFDANAVYATPFTVTLGGQTINVTPLQTFPNYTLYGGNIPSTMAGQSETLSFTETADFFNEGGMFELDNIQFSPSSIPEPGAIVLTAMGALFLGFSCRRR